MGSPAGTRWCSMAITWTFLLTPTCTTFMGITVTTTAWLTWTPSYGSTSATVLQVQRCLQ